MMRLRIQKLNFAFVWNVSMLKFFIHFQRVSFLIYLFLMQTSCLVFFRFTFMVFWFTDFDKGRSNLLFKNNLQLVIFFFFKVLRLYSDHREHLTRIKRSHDDLQHSKAPQHHLTSYLSFFRVFTVNWAQIIFNFWVFLRQHSTVWFIEKLFPINWQWPIKMRVYWS